MAMVVAGLSACEAPSRPVVASQDPAAGLPAQSGVASYNGPEFAGKTTASGAPHRPEALTAASRTLPLGTVAKVTNQETFQSVAVEVNDRGPFAEGPILDVSKTAAARLGMTGDGVAPVTVEPLAQPAAGRVPHTGP